MPSRANQDGFVRADIQPYLNNVNVDPQVVCSVRVSCVATFTLTTASLQQAALLQHCASKLDPSNASVSRRRAVVFAAFLIVIQRNAIIASNRLQVDRELKPYENRLKKVVDHPAVKNLLSSLERNITESYGLTGKNGNIYNFAEADIEPMARRLTEIVEENLLDELDEPTQHQRGGRQYPRTMSVADDLYGRTKESGRGRRFRNSTGSDVRRGLCETG
ncbi:hypothetical protein OF83DRAFT_531846 [Amylostereum chailletii]|nr:hypothetical protein OF83DRAFT_531846 [Amylostereum chailletii]